MRQVAQQKAKDLEMAARDWLCRIFGRNLEDDEIITLTTSLPHPAPTGAERVAAMNALKQSMDRLDLKAREGNEAELESAIEEAIQSVRRWKD